MHGALLGAPCVAEDDGEVVHDVVPHIGYLHAEIEGADLRLFLRAFCHDREIRITSEASTAFGDTLTLSRYVIENREGSRQFAFLFLEEKGQDLRIHVVEHHSNEPGILSDDRHGPLFAFGYRDEELGELVADFVKFVRQADSERLPNRLRGHRPSFPGRPSR